MTEASPKTDSAECPIPAPRSTTPIGSYALLAVLSGHLGAQRGSLDGALGHCLDRVP
jgi:hypothetical protein